MRNKSTEQENSNPPKDTKQQSFQNVNIRLVPKNVTSTKIDYTRSYTANNFITAVRAMNDYLLGAK